MLARGYCIFTAILCLTTSAGALTYEWNARSGEAGFRVDIPEGWRTWESVKRNGVIVQFRRGTARIEVRSMAAKEGFSTQQILNQKAARLSAEYPLVKYLGERPSRHSAELTLTSWEIRAKGKVFIDETAVYLAPEGPVVVSCMVLQKDLAKHRTFCENAFYSLSLGGIEAAPETTKIDIVQNLQRIYFVHMPGTLPAIAPEALLVTPAQQPAPKPVMQYDENYILPSEENR